ncbi:hypothetical protein KO506_05130 [Polaribacter vadi]|uniref:hypothetical protein n=1 Tax=Polaribacter TaxID=52959 RepID=UPI001C09987E|nr:MULTISPECIES: hypothetical protein [Polaribacter]MBU3010773.1 hypothetical protein [Polaribacter vadi]MDO6740584.1 hypothetical protein [Polaribacter sp. 1_MG-2023]
MKKISLLVLIATVAFVFTSCSNEETTQVENQNVSLLKTFEVKRDATGAYSVNFDVSDNTKIDKFTDLSENKSEFHLTSSDLFTQKSVSEELLIDNNNLKVGFVDANTNGRKFISIIDDNITFLSKSDDNIKLSSYSVLANEDGSYDLAFSVKNNVEVSFVYNEEIATYEVHLEDGKSGDLDFTRTLEKEEGSPLKIDFVNHISNENAKSSSESQIRKPRILVDTND